MSEPSPESPDIAARVREAVAAASDLKAIDLRVLHLAPVSDFTDYFLLMSGGSDRQVQALAEAVEERLAALRVKPLHTEGWGKGKWVLLDYGDFVVHVFDDERRGFYALERLWSDAPDVTGDFTDRHTAGELDRDRTSRRQG
jgi:ribosome-associated protein